MPGMTDRDHFAAAALTGLLASREWPIDSDEAAHYCYRVADAMLRERAKTNHDAAPAARAPEPEPEPAARRRPAGGTGNIDHGAAPAARASVDSVAPQPTTRGESDRNDKAAPRPSEGTGDTPDSPQPIACSVFDRSQPIAKPTPVHTPPAHATPGEGSEQRECTEPVAWAVMLADGERIYDVYATEEEAKAIDEAVTGNHGIVPLYRKPTLTDEESDDLRMWFAECMDQSTAATDRANEELSARWLLRAHRAAVMLDRLGGWR